jgi:hypothetical protein
MWIHNVGIYSISSSFVGTFEQQRSFGTERSRTYDIAAAVDDDGSLRGGSHRHRIQNVDRRYKIIIII